jgi:hypothetical protein
MLLLLTRTLHTIQDMAALTVTHITTITGMTFIPIQIMLPRITQETIMDTPYQHKQGTIIIFIIMVLGTLPT